MNFNIIDNLGVPMFQVDYSNPYLWVGNFGHQIDVRASLGSLGSPLVVHGMDDDGRIMDMSIQEYIKYVEYLERGKRRNLILDELIKKGM